MGAAMPYSNDCLDGLIWQKLRSHVRLLVHLLFFVTKQESFRLGRSRQHLEFECRVSIRQCRGSRMDWVTAQSRLRFASELLKSSSSSLHNFSPRGAQENCALVVGVPFKNRHYEDESIKRREAKHRRNFDTLAPRFITGNRRRGRGFVCAAGPWVDHALRGLYDGSSGPRASPLLEDRPSLACVLQGRLKALLGFLMIASK